jgi:hypothetical protein
LPLLSPVHWHHKVKVNVFRQTVPLPVQVREMSSDSLRRREIISELHASCLWHLNLSDDGWAPWASSVTMGSFQLDLENVIVALQSNCSLQTIGISKDILAAIGESDQRRLFCNVGNLPTLQRMSLYSYPDTAIHMRVVADALSETSNGLKALHLSGFKISSRLEVEQLARGLKARVASLDRLILEDIVIDVEVKTGFLDPILLALAHLPGEPRGKVSYFRLSCVEAELNGVSIVYPEALGAFFTEEPIETPMRYFLLNNLGLNDNHCEVIAQELARDDAFLRPRDGALLRRIVELDLTGNPSIGQHGYVGLLGLLNRRFDIVAVEVDDQNWKTTFELVIFMNLQHHRGRFLENGAYPSKAMWVDFLAGISADSYWSVEDEAQKLNAIWYTLREGPDFICA